MVFAWRDQHEYEIPAEEVARLDRERRTARQAWLQQSAEQQAIYGGSFEAFFTQGYHDVFVAPVCLGAAKAFFDAQRQPS